MNPNPFPVVSHKNMHRMKLLKCMQVKGFEMFLSDRTKYSNQNCYQKVHLSFIKLISICFTSNYFFAVETSICVSSIVLLGSDVFHFHVRSSFRSVPCISTVTEESSSPIGRFQITTTIICRSPRI